MSDPSTVRVRSCLQRKCICCGKKFRPHPRLGARQRLCGKDTCRKLNRTKYQRRYRKENPLSEQAIRSKIRESRTPDFWKTYRKNNISSTDRNRANSRLKKHLTKTGLQRKLDIVQLFVPIDKSDTLLQFATSHRSLLCECQGSAAA